MNEEPRYEGPLTWNEKGQLVPLDAVEAARQTSITKDVMASQPELADHRRISFSEFIRIRCIEMATFIDDVFHPQESNNLESLGCLIVVAGCLMLGVFSHRWWLGLVLLGAMIGVRILIQVVIQRTSRKSR